MEKYKLTNETVKYLEKTLYRIEALKTFGIITKGQKGGFIEAEKNLSQFGDAWVSGDAWVFGNACVSGDAWVSGNARVSGDGRVSADARVSGNARVFSAAWVSGDGRV